jgi:Zn-dependent peptidase ImmA (M78 family)/transcriptional regulator with XRE-family HTH domain
MVVLARESRGLTQKELAELTFVAQATISKIESGVRSPGEDVLRELSRALRYPTDFFYQPDRVYGLGLGELFHRKRRSVPVKTLLRLHATVNIWRMHLDRLLDGVQPVECRIPRADLEELNFDVREIARRVRASWSLPKGPVSNLCLAIEDAGGIVIPFDFETKLIDAVSHWVPPLPPLFFMNTVIPTDRMRFTLAHEVGHMVMHQDSHTYFQVSDAKEVERQADEFAGELLMPEREISPQLDNVSLYKLALLKPHWKVSMAALLMQAERLQRVSPRTARSLWAQMSQKGWRRREPANLDLPAERPTFIQELVEFYQKELRYSPQELSQALHADEGDIRAWYYKQGQQPLHIVP